MRETIREIVRETDDLRMDSTVRLVEVIIRLQLQSWGLCRFRSVTHDLDRAVGVKNPPLHKPYFFTDQKMFEMKRRICDRDNPIPRLSYVSGQPRWQRDDAADQPDDQYHGYGSFPARTLPQRMHDRPVSEMEQ